MIMIEIQYKGGSRGSMEPPFLDRPLTSLDIILISFYYKIIIILHLIRNKRL